MAGSSISQPALQGQSRGRSAIKFPYSDLDDAIELAQTIYSRVDERCSLSRLSAYLGYKNVKSGAFRLKVSSAKFFGLVAIEGGRVRLQPLGSRILDTRTATAARRDAFLSVPLYKRLFERYDGYQLPPDVGLEREMASLGVTAKQVAKARQTFQRSAQQAGFFAEGQDRLVTPSSLRGPGSLPLEEEGSENKKVERDQREEPKGHRGTGIEALHPLISALIGSIPASNDAWPREKRDQWLQAAEDIFRLVYGD